MNPQPHKRTTEPSLGRRKFLATAAAMAGAAASSGRLSAQGSGSIMAYVGAYTDRGGGDGLGMKIVDQRIKQLLGSEYGVSVACVPDELTRVTVRLPIEGVRR